MKKIFIFLIAVVAIIFVVIKINKKENLDLNDLGNEINTVQVSSSMPNEVVKYEDIKIEGITLNEDNKTLTFKMSAEKTYEEVKLSVVLLNPQVEQSANTKSLVIKNLKNTKIINLDLNNIYNNPEKIKFVIEK